MIYNTSRVFLVSILLYNKLLWTIILLFHPSYHSSKYLAIIWLEDKLVNLKNFKWWTLLAKWMYHTHVFHRLNSFPHIIFHLSIWIILFHSFFLLSTILWNFKWFYITFVKSSVSPFKNSKSMKLSFLKISLIWFSNWIIWPSPCQFSFAWFLPIVIGTFISLSD